MSTSTEAKVNGVQDHVLRPRAVKPADRKLLQTKLSDDVLSTGIATAASSGRSTPVPPDAPPSVQSLSSAKKQVRAEQKRRIFPTIDYAPRVSHFDPDSDYRDFRGFFSLFWIGLAIMVITTVARNVQDTGHPFRGRIWSLFTVRTWQLGLSDAAMVASTALSLPLQILFRRSNGWLRWNQGGMAIQSIFQLLWLALWVSWPFLLHWTWTANVYFTLHTLAILMKMHSYAFYNGHLSETEKRLRALDHPSTASTEAAVRYPSPNTEVHERVEEEKKLEEEQSLASLREDLAFELTSPLGRVSYPQNLTVWNFADYLLCPTLCYELEYPRTEKIRWSEIVAKGLAVFGCIFLLTVISEEFVLPVLNESSSRLEGARSMVEMGLILAESISLLLFPFMLNFLLVFLVIFEYVLGFFAEVTCFADRRFYADWWNSTDWLEFSREWNIPVHHWFRRHVYFASRTHMSKSMATLITFLTSALAHELVMACMTQKLRGYGFIAMMLQLPIVMLQRTPWVRGKKVFNNVCFWISMILGLSMMCALYVLV